MVRLVRVVGSAALASLAVGCTLLQPYPDDAVELCTGGVDEDLDGLVDCADPNCIGQCPEESAATCANGDDDDGDGHVDLDDPRCWPFGRVTLHACRTIAGTELSIASTGGAFGYNRIVAVADPAGSGSDVSGAIDATYGEIRTVDPITGSWAGFRLDARVYLDPAAGSGSLNFEFGDFAAIIATSGLDLGMTGDDVNVALDPAAVWRTVSLTVARVDTRLVATLEVERPGGAPARLTYSFPEDWPEQFPLDFAASFHGGALMDGLVLHRPRYDECRFPEPFVTGSGAVAVRSPDLWCIVTGSWTSSSPDGGTFTRGSAPAYHPSSDLESPNSPIWDPAAGRFRALAVEAMSGEVWTLSSADCEGWALEGPALANTLERIVFHPVIPNYFGMLSVPTDQGARYEIWWWDGSALRMWSSPDGSAGTFERAPAAELTGLAGEVAGDLAGVRLAMLGGERVYMATSLVGSPAVTFPEAWITALLPRSDGGFREIFHVEPSRVLGTFDRTDVLRLDLLLTHGDAGWGGVLFEDARSRGVTLGGTGGASGGTFASFVVAPRS